MLRRIIIGLVFAIALSAGPHAYAAISEDSANVGSSVGTSNPFTVSITTAGTNELIVLFISMENNSTDTGVTPPSVSSVTDNTGTTQTWARIIAAHNNGNDGTVGIGMNTEIWAVCAPSQVTGKAATVTFTGGSPVDQRVVTIISYIGQGCDPVNGWETGTTRYYELASGANWTETVSTRASNVAVVAFSTSPNNANPSTNICGSTAGTNSYGSTSTGTTPLSRFEQDRFASSPVSNQQTGWCTANGGSTPTTVGSNGGWMAVLVLCNPCLNANSGDLFLKGCCAQRPEDYLLVPVAYRREQ